MALRTKPKPAGSGQPNLSSMVPTLQSGIGMNANGQIQAPQQRDYSGLGSGAISLGTGTTGPDGTLNFSDAPVFRARTGIAYGAGSGAQLSDAQGHAINGGYTPAGAQGSQTGQNAALQALQQMGQFTGSGWTGAEQNAYNQAALGQNRQAQAGIQALAQQAAARGMANGGAMYGAQAGAAQQGANNLGQIGADIGMGAQNRQLGAIGQQYQMGQGIDAAASGRGGALDQFTQWLTGTGIGAEQQDYANRTDAQRYNQAQTMQMIGQLGSMYGSALSSGIGGGH